MIWGLGVSGSRLRLSPSGKRPSRKVRRAEMNNRTERVTKLLQTLREAPPADPKLQGWVQVFPSSREKRGRKGDCGRGWQELHQREEVQQRQQVMDAMLRVEDYPTAIRLRDEIRALEEAYARDPAEDLQGRVAWR
jgi:hypothetical protein